MEAKHDGFDLTSKNDSYKHKNQVWSLSQTISVCFFSRTKLLIGIEGKSMMAAEIESSGRATCSSKNLLSNPTRPAV